MEGVRLSDDPKVALTTGVVVGWLARADAEATLDAIQAARREAPHLAPSIAREQVLTNGDRIRAVAAPIPIIFGLVDWWHVAAMCNVLEAVRNKRAARGEGAMEVKTSLPTSLPPG